jgi:hypothetical protein
MIEIVINFDQNSKMYKVYEPTSDTLLITSNLSESLIKLSEFLRNSGMIQSDILASDCISYHLDSATMIAMIESNVSLLKRLAQAPSVFTSSAQKFGKSLTSGGFQGNKNKEDKFVSKNKNFFSKSSFKNSLKKFG